MLLRDASLPLLFAVHQFAGGFVRLGLQGQVPADVDAAAAYFCCSTPRACSRH